MSLDLTGLHNHNEFFFEHYLAALFEGDLKERLQTWEELGDQSPARLVRSLLRRWNHDFLRPYNDVRGQARSDLAAKFLGELSTALGFSNTPETVNLPEAEGLRLFASVPRADATPGVWVLLAREPEYAKSEDSSEDEEFGRDTPLLWPAHCLDWDPSVPKDLQGNAFTIDKLLGDEIFAREPAPRWVLLLSPWQVVLCDRNKWAERRFLRFDLETLSSRKEDGALQAVAALLHRQSLQPDEGLGLLDELDDRSHKHAFGVSEDLKYALRESIEDLGNESVWYIRNHLKQKVFDRDLAGPLTRESLRFMYRLLFLFYLEARPELGYLPKRRKMRSRDPYWSGYSLESLRDLELVRLTTEESRTGYFLHHSLRRLMDLVYRGFKPITQERMTLEEADSHIGGFELPALNAHLFDPEYDPETGNEDVLKLLRQVRFRNSVLQRVIQRMSLGKSGSGKRRRRGRISYAQLGINQLGAVYEGLLSFRGFFAEEDLFEVRRLVKEKAPEEEEDGEGEAPLPGGEAAGEPAQKPFAGNTQATDPLDTAYFVTKAQLAECREEEKVWESNGAIPKIKRFEKGSFIYRMAGRDREKSASYYTPAELTQTLVKYALLELLKDKTADQILELTVCEPAMGSAAFLNEAVDQLADAYLQRKQTETDQHLAVELYAREKQKVKMFMADNRVFGLDLNPVAVELAEVSLWLGTLHPEALVPWFRLQLNCGNSLVGARRSVVSFHGLDPREPGEPKRQAWDKPPAKGTAWHWLLPDNGMADFGDKVIKTIAPEGLAQAKVWRKAFCGPVDPSEQQQMEALTRESEMLWQAHAKQLAALRLRTTDVIDIWGQPHRDKKISNTREKDHILDGELYNRHLHASSPYRRLKLAMDYWCALWFWPIEKSHLLPDRQQWLLELGLLLHGEVREDSVAEPSLFPDTAPDEYRDFLKDHGLVDVEKLSEGFPRFKLVAELAERHRFFHWELEYADIFVNRGGFDLILGNPPWLKVEWNESGVMGDANPLFVLRKQSAPEMAKLREQTLAGSEKLRLDYLAEFESLAGLQNFINAQQNYPLLMKSQSNLYKCFLPLSWHLGSKKGVSAFLHQEGIYDDPNSGPLRIEVYSRLRFHFQFQNQMMLFPIGDREKYSINIYGSHQDPDFLTLNNLFLPKTIPEALEHDGRGLVGGIKNDENNWNTLGHRERVIHVSAPELELFAKLFDDQDTPAIQARLPTLHAKSLIEVLRRFSASSKRLGDLNKRTSPSVMWDETNAVKKDGTIRRETVFPKGLEDWILSGPHINVGNPFNKSPKRICTEKAHYDPLELSEMPDGYLSRTNYIPAVSHDEYLRRIPQVDWDGGFPITKLYRLAFRAMLNQSGERTLIGCIVPPDCAHINGIQTIAFESDDLLLRAASFSHSLVADWFIKSTGRSNLHHVWHLFPLIDANVDLFVRTLSLNCLTSHYADLWKATWNDGYRKQGWSKSDPRLDKAFWKNLGPKWNRQSALRSDYARRQALIEIDVLAAKALNITLDELITLYRIQFPVLRQNESDTWYDTTGRIVFTCNRGLTGVGLPRKSITKGKVVTPGWEDVRDMRTGTVTRIIMDDTLPGGPLQRTITYTAPFDRCNREDDYRVAWEKL